MPAAGTLQPSIAKHTRARPRTPGWLYTTASVALVALVGAVAFTSRAAPPPTIAEFAPQAVERITDPSHNTAGKPGDVAEESNSAEQDRAADAAAAGSLIDVARVRTCVGDPPRQIEEPQSPPCVPHWSGDNGGATAKGVTRDEIVLIANARDFDPRTTRIVAATHLWVAFFNKRFEFYGRKIKPVIMPAGASGDGQSAAQRADAVDYDTRLKPFVSTDKIDGAQFEYSLELARRGVLATAHYGVTTTDVARRHRPYMWTYATSTDQQMSNIGNWACARLAGRPAAHAGRSNAEDLSTKRRVFGVVVQMWRAAQELSPAPVVRELERCNAAPVKTFVYANDGDRTADDNMILQMKQAGVTTILRFGDGGAAAAMTRSSTAQLYFPEWIINSVGAQDSNWFAKLSQPDQLAHAFGLTFFPKHLPPSQQPAVWAAQEMDPTFAPPSNDIDAYFWRVMYKQLLLISSGIQMAGPHLTPQTFEAGLHKTRFPNSVDVAQQAGAVGFTTGDWSMTDDAAEIWWSQTAQGPMADDRGAYCYVDGGVRHSFGRYPTDPGRFFQPPCDTGA